MLCSSSSNNLYLSGQFVQDNTEGLLLTTSVIVPITLFVLTFNPNIKMYYILGLIISIQNILNAIKIFTIISTDCVYI